MALDDATTFENNVAVGGTLAVTGAITAVGGVTGDVTGDLTGNVTGNSFATLVADQNGAGVVGTSDFGAPKMYRRTQDGTIVTTVLVDITGLACKGDAAKDAIGLAAGGAAYLCRYTTADFGIVYRVEMACIELPGQGTATITADIDLGAEDVGTTEYDGAVDDIILNTGSLAAGQVAVNNTPSLTANDYIYLIEGDTAATTGIYNAGQFIITFYGHTLLA